MSKLIFTLSECESIKITTSNFNTIDYCCSEMQAYFLNEQQLLCIGQDTAGGFFESFITKLKTAIDRNLQLHESLTQNLGFMYNEKRQGKQGFFMIKASDNKSIYWVGANYKIWSTYTTTKPILSTWLYNDYEGNIIFEITKNYKWSAYPDEPEDPNFVTYDEFMKDYKPLIHRVIPRDVAIQWLEQAMKIYRGIFKSEEDYVHACKENNW